MIRIVPDLLVQGQVQVLSLTAGRAAEVLLLHQDLHTVRAAVLPKAVQAVQAAAEVEVQAAAVVEAAKAEGNI